MLHPTFGGGGGGGSQERGYEAETGLQERKHRGHGWWHVSLSESLSAGALCRLVLASEVLNAGVPKWRQEMTGTKKMSPRDALRDREGQKVQAWNSRVESTRLTSGYQERGGLARLDAGDLSLKKMNAFQL